MAEKSIYVRTALMPLYYKEFHCIMGACQDNCCDDGWRIEFDKKDYLKVKQAVQSPELKARMAQSMRRLHKREHDGQYAEFCVTQAGRCAFHTEDGLCRLQAECGAEALPEVCQVFPRQKVNTPAGQELSLSTACEGVLGLLWDHPEGIVFLEEPLPEKEWVQMLPSSSASSRFADIRALCIDVMQQQTLKLPHRLLLLGILVQQLQSADWEEEGVFDRWLARGRRTVSTPPNDLEAMPTNQRIFISHNLRVLVRLLTTHYADTVRELMEAVGGKNASEVQDIRRFKVNAAHYQELEDRLDSLLGHSEIFFENLIVTQAFRLLFPTLTNPEELWQSYMNLCTLYSFFRFCAVCAMDKEATRERLFHILVMASRSLLHSPGRREVLRDELLQNDSATLAHMAILLGG